MNSSLVAHGPRAVEARLLQWVEEQLLPTEGKEPAARLGRPVRVIVPSALLREHLAARLLEHFRRPLAGIVIQTLWGAALEIHERCAVSIHKGDLLQEVLVERLARGVPALEDPLAGLADGFRGVTGVVRDLLDAGLEEPLRDPILDALRLWAARGGTTRVGHRAVERGEALVRVAAGMERLLNSLELDRSSTIYARALRLLTEKPDHALPSRGLLIHGFADATGRATDLLQGLLQSGGGAGRCAVLFDLPPDPAAVATDGQPTPVEGSFADRLRERLGEGSLPTEPREETPPVKYQAFTAAGTDAEGAELVQRLQRLLGGPERPRPETVAIVARDLSPYRLPLARQLRRAGIPFSPYRTAGAMTAAGRSAEAVRELLQRRGEIAADRWVEARRGPEHSPMALRLLLRAAGAARLRQVAELDADLLTRDREALPLPLRQGLLDPDLEDAPEGRVRTLPAVALREALAAARQILQRLESWPEEAPTGEHLERLQALLTVDLRWNPNDPSTAPVLRAVAAAEGKIPHHFPLTRAEFSLVVAQLLRTVGPGDLGGRGGGVQLLTVTEARGLTFDHLFLIGLNRDLFPRPVREDPLLPDAVRRALGDLLPDIPIKGRGFQEERYLFAQLLAAAPHVTLSWQTEDDDGKARSPSPLVERLRWNPHFPDPETTAEGNTKPPRRSLRPAEDHALAAALAGGREALRPLYGAAVRESGAVAETAAVGPSKVAELRLRLLDELDPDLSTEEGRERAVLPGPYMGYLGALTPERHDPRHRELYITALERLAGCPWQSFVGRLLRVEPLPDPLLALPTIDALLLGQVVHRILERMVEPASARRDLAAVLERSEERIAWPRGAAFSSLLRQETQALLQEEGMPLPGLRVALERRALPYLQVAQSWLEEEGAAVLGAEVTGSLTVEVAQKTQDLHFRADWVDRVGETLRLTDFKTGKPISEAKTPATRARHFLNAVERGKLLQGVAYHLAAGQALPGTPVEGRYLFLKPETEEDLRLATTGGESSDSQALQDAFGKAVATLLKAREAGTFFPRLTDPQGDKEPSRCGYCPVAEGCLRHDSGFRRRLVRVAGAAAEEIGTGGEVMQNLWEMG